MINTCVCVCGLGVEVVECHMLTECLLDNKAGKRQHGGNHQLCKCWIFFFFLNRKSLNSHGKHLNYFMFFFLFLIFNYERLELLKQMQNISSRGAGSGRSIACTRFSGNSGAESSKVAHFIRFLQVEMIPRMYHHNTVIIQWL